MRLATTFFALMALIVLSAAAAGAADMPTWKLADAQGLAASEWAAAAQDAGHSYRAAKAGAQATLQAPVWWGEARRPAEGALYNVRISYKDTATTPIVFLSHAGVGSYAGPSEVHRFGGLADGQWKTADVPLSWDLIIRKNAPGNVTELFLHADKDLPVESVVVTEITEGRDRRAARARYERETREWVARVQADKQKSAGAGRKQTPVLPADLKTPLVPFVRTYMTELLPNAAPQKGEAGKPIQIRMTRREYETAAVGVYANGADLKNVRLTVRRQPQDRQALQIEVRTAEYSAVAGGSRGATKSYSLFPQRMWRSYAVDIPAGRSHLFWITARTVGEASTPGKHTAEAVFEADGLDQVRVPVEIEILPVTLPTMQEAGLDLGSCIGGLIPLQDLKTLAEFNHTGMDIWFGGAQPKMKTVDGKLVNDWYYMDDWMQYAAGKCGMTHMFWFLGGDPYGFPDSVTFERDIYRAKENDSTVGRRKFIEETNANPDKVVPAIRDLYVEWVRQLAVHAKEAGWPKRMILHPFDEPAKWVQKSKWDNPWHPVIGTGEWIKPHFKDACALIRQGAKGRDNVVTGGDIHHAVPGIIFTDDIDVFCTNAIHEDTKLGEKVRATGTEFWQYSGCNDQAPAHRARFSFGWYFGAYDSVGSLIWAYNTMGRFDTSDGGGWGYGWYTPFGTVQTPYLIGVREGWDDRRLIALYKKTVVPSDPAAAKALDAIFKQAVASRSAGGRDTVYDFYAEIAGYERMDTWRNQLLDAVVKHAKR
ncbi:MAG TPA: hypothetical protein VFJ30_02895 [Phycisphaerae bacterium]|nr:hypothetical protein [Phycisphaerae bacterium]